MEIGSIYEMNPNCIEQTGFCGETTFYLKEVEKHSRENTVYTASAREAILPTLPATTAAARA